MNDLRFVAAMAWREMRSAWGRLAFFFVCVALGVAALVALRSVVQHVRRTLIAESRLLVGADIVVQSLRPWSPEHRAAIDRALTSPAVGLRTEVIETQTMASTPGAVHLVELRGVEAAFPIYGTLELEGGKPYSHALIEGHGVLVQPDVLTRFGLAVGDRINLAGQAFEIRGVVTRDRVQRTRGFAFGPRVYVDVTDLRALGILAAGSRATYMVFVKVAEPAMTPVTEALERAVPKEIGTTRSWKTLEDQIGRNLAVSERFLSLVGFSMVVLGGLGVWSVTRVFVQQKITSVAVLKCLGASSRVVLGTYALQTASLAAGGSGLGIGLAAVGLWAVPPRVVAALGLTHVGITASAAFQGAAVGVLVSLLFAIVPLLEIRRVKPLVLLRADARPAAGRQDLWSRAAGAGMAGVLALVAIWQSGSLRAGLFVTAGLAAMGLLLALASRLLTRVIRPLVRSPRFAVRHAVVSLGRPGNQTRVILMAVGLGCFFVLSMRAVQVSLLEEIGAAEGQHLPDLILIDVQKDQAEGVRALVTPYVQGTPRLMPLIRGRVVGVEGRRVQLKTYQDVQKQGALTREYGMTFRPALEDNEKVIAGKFWRADDTAAAAEPGIDTEVSIAELVHDEASVDVGDVMRFDVGGRVLAARVTSIRRVVWGEAQNGGFVFVLRPAPPVAKVPHSYLAFLEMGGNRSAQGSLERALAPAFPNVSAIDVGDVLKTIRDTVDNIALAVTIVGAVTLFGGVLILIGSVSMTRFQRLKDAAIYRTLGASTRVLAEMVGVEYGLVGALAGLLGATGAIALSWAVSKWLFEMPWHSSFFEQGVGFLATVFIVSVVGVLASLDVLIKKPLQTLRQE